MNKTFKFIIELYFYIYFDIQLVCSKFNPLKCKVTSSRYVESSFDCTVINPLLVDISPVRGKVTLTLVISYKKQKLFNICKGY